MSSRTIMICDLCENDIGDSGAKGTKVIPVRIGNMYFDVCRSCANEGNLGKLVAKAEAPAPPKRDQRAHPAASS